MIDRYLIEYRGAKTDWQVVAGELPENLDRAAAVCLTEIVSGHTDLRITQLVADTEGFRDVTEDVLCHALLAGNDLARAVMLVMA